MSDKKFPYLAWINQGSYVFNLVLVISVDFLDKSWVIVYVVTRDKYLQVPISHISTVDIHTTIIH